MNEHEKQELIDKLEHIELRIINDITKFIEKTSINDKIDLKAFSVDELLNEISSRSLVSVEQQEKFSLLYGSEYIAVIKSTKPFSTL